ncbi:MAG: DUF4350 domain-containing protein [Thainema sp.]
MIRSRRVWLVAGLFVVVLIVMSLVTAPASNKLLQGSTYSRFPSGYGAWYAYMQQHSATIERWQKPLEQLQEQTAAEDVPTTLIRISPLSYVWSWQADYSWVEEGNTLILVGNPAPVSEADFMTQQESEEGLVQIDTRRRETELEDATVLLGDEYGAIAWQIPQGAGQLIVIIPPYIAANAYQDESGNFAFLAGLAEQAGGKIWVDEYLHGYQDADAETTEEATGSWIAYLAQTPWSLVLLQAVVIILVALLASYRRLGHALALPSVEVNNSEAYMQALAQVLRKAKSQAFLVDTIAKEERLQLQRKLGLGIQPVDDQKLVETWTQKTGRPATELQQILHPPVQIQSLRESDLMDWLRRLQTARSQI